ncbi:NAD(P)H-dependent flavin oxidoreductase [Brytella acorum]|uniref:Nitronate monooxygenase n=1 Tax=Brytella acorum TaxID=2959299 RepID=A0AA35Y4W2_9PROT|nr:nitronate monooxygenase [Brytella acorum]CAI9121484.1 nitronate monooxygenase [Brytella acorum]
MTEMGTAALLKCLNIELPILQAPMAGVSSPAMAAAVSDAGGLGAIGVGAAGVKGAREMIADIRARTTRPFNVNVFAHRPATPDPAREAAWIDRLRPRFAELGEEPPVRLREIYTSFNVDDAMLAMLLEARPAVVSLHFGLGDPSRLAALRQAGIVVLASVTSLAEARQAVAAGVDAVVAQGYEAGGHRGLFDPHGPDDRLGTVVLTRLLAASIDLPVIAAGGLMDGRGIAAALALGAAAAQLGTAYVGTDESLADDAYRAALFGDAAWHTVMTRAISGRPARCLANRFTARAVGIDDAAIPDYPTAYDLGKALNAAGKAAGDGGYGAQWAGQGAPLARRMSAGALTRALAAELR